MASGAEPIAQGDSTMTRRRNVPNLEAIRVLERWQPIGHRSERRRVARGRRLLVERLVRPLVVELLAKDSAAEANRSTLIADIPFPAPGNVAAKRCASEKRAFLERHD